MRISDWSSDVCSSDLLEQPLFGFLDLVGGGFLDLGVIGAVDHILADADQLAPQRQVMDHLGVVFGIDDGGGGVGEAGEVGERKSGGRGKSESGRVVVGGWRCHTKQKETAKIQT